MTFRLGMTVVTAALAAGSVSASEQAIDLPAGQLGNAVAELGRQTGTSIAVDDPNVWIRRVPALRGRMSVRKALVKLALITATDLRSAGPRGWRLAKRVAPAAKSRRAFRAPPFLPVLLPQSPEPANAEIVVTASKRDMRLTDFGGQASAITGAELMFGGPNGTGAIISRVASLSSTQLGSGRNKLFIRGIADSSFTGPTQATVGQYFGDIRLSYNAPDPDLRLHDVASVEVLEGPQGTLYGAGALGGIIRTTPNVPNSDHSAAFTVGASATQHGDPGADIAATVNVPIIDKRLELRLVGYAESEGGYIDNPLRGRDDINRTSVVGGRAALRVHIADRWTIDLGGLAQTTRSDDSQYADRGAPSLTRASPVPENYAADYVMGNIAVAGELADLRFRSTFGLSRQVLLENFNATPAAGPPSVFRQRNKTRMITNETRLWQPMRTGLGWLLGASFTSNRSQLVRALGPLEGPLVQTTGVTNALTEVTVYGEASYELRRNLIVTGGLRATAAWLTGRGEDVAPMIALARAQVTATRDELSLLPSVAVVATVLPRTTVYARYQQGFRPGGLAIEADFVRRFSGDRVRTLETGIRYGRSASDPAYLTGTISYTIWDKIQADFIDASGLPSTANIGDGRIWTFGLAGGVRPVEGLTFDVALNYNDSRITNPGPTLRQTLAQMSQIPNVAKFTGRVGVDYRKDIGTGLTVRANAWARYVGTSRLGVGPLLGESQGDYLDTAIIVRIGRPAVGLTMTLTNLANSVGNRFALGTPFQIGTGQITPLRPRTLRIGLDAAF